MVVSTWAKFIEEFDHVDEHYISSITIGNFLKYIERERLTSMPHRGSRWDKVLKWAEFFALQVANYSTAVEPFVPDSRDASKLILAACRVLLEVSFPSSMNVWVLTKYQAWTWKRRSFGNDVWRIL